jgi:4-hydroxy-L-threonine phosphate dehydrogenase PdxA
MSKVAKIGFIMGDAAGIGPEIIIKTLVDDDLRGKYRPIIIGSNNIMEMVKKAVGVKVTFTEISAINEDNHIGEEIELLNREVLANTNFRWGVADEINGKNSIEYLKVGLSLASMGYLDGLVIAPLNKKSMYMAGSRYADEGAMMQDMMNVPLVKIVTKWKKIYRSQVVDHVCFKDILNNLKVEKIVQTIECLGKTITFFNQSKPRIGVAALNPHAGEAGELGDEEALILAPAIEESRKFGFSVSGPYPADTIFKRALENQLDGIAYLYHDQGHIAMKAVAFGEGVLIYSGLPFPVTGPGHGTAYGRAGKGYADHKNFAEATKTCIEMIVERL